MKIRWIHIHVYLPGIPITCSSLLLVTDSSILDCEDNTHRQKNIYIKNKTKFLWRQ